MTIDVMQSSITDNSGSPVLEDVEILIGHYKLLQRDCDEETDRLERLATSITKRTERRLQQLEAGSAQQRSFRAQAPAHGLPTDEADWIECVPGVHLMVSDRADISRRFKVPCHTFGTTSTLRGGSDLELEALELSELRIQNYVSQMRLLENEIAAIKVTSVAGALGKLRFMAELGRDGSEFAVDLLPLVLETMLSQIERVLVCGCDRTGPSAA